MCSQYEIALRLQHLNVSTIDEFYAFIACLIGIAAHIFRHFLSHAYRALGTHFPTIEFVKAMRLDLGHLEVAGIPNIS